MSSIEIIRKHKFTLRAECVCGWRHIEFRHNEATDFDNARFDRAIAKHERVCKAEGKLNADGI